MKIKGFLVVLMYFAWISLLQASPNFWDSQSTATPTAPSPPKIEAVEDLSESKVPAQTPVSVPSIEAPTPTPTPQEGLRPKDPTLAALMSVVVPGSGHVYAGDPIKGVAFAAVFGIGLWQTIDNLFDLVPSGGVPPTLVAKDETLGNLFGLVTLAAYGFGIQDAYSTAANYNRTHYLTLRFEISPRPTASLACLF